jgi:hypothetical protein
MVAANLLGVQLLQPGSKYVRVLGTGQVLGRETRMQCPGKSILTRCLEKTSDA